MKVLILEDDKGRHLAFQKKWIGWDITIVDSVEKTILFLQEVEWDLLCLDHDLNGQVYVPSGPGTGFEVAVWLATNPKHEPKMVITHSLNKEGVDRIRGVYAEAVHLPFAWQISKESLEKMFKQWVKFQIEYRKLLPTVVRG